MNRRSGSDHPDSRRSMTDPELRAAFRWLPAVAPSGLADGISAELRTTGQRRPLVRLPELPILDPRLQRAMWFLVAAALVAGSLLTAAVVASQLRSPLPANGPILWLAPDGRLRSMDWVNGRVVTEWPIAPDVHWDVDDAADLLATITSLPDGRRQLLVIRPDRAEVLRLDAPDGTIWEQRCCTGWAPSGHRLIATLSQAGVPRLALVDADTGSLRILGDPPFTSDSFAWSPDGASLAIVETTGASFRDRRLLRYDLADGAVTMLVDEGGTDLWGMGWSPDGHHLLYVTGETADSWTRDRALWSIGADGSGVTRLTRPDVAPFGGAWSPDGSRIVYSAGMPGADCRPQVRLMAADGSQDRLVRAGALDAGWSPDGRLILAFLGDPGGLEAPTLVTIDPAAGETRTVADFAALGYSGRDPRSAGCWVWDLGGAHWTHR